jgi:hypothetical protein
MVGDLAHLAVAGGNAAVLLAAMLQQIDALENLESTGGIGVEGENSAVILYRCLHGLSWIPPRTAVWSFLVT